MREDKVKEATYHWLEEQEWTVKSEVGVSGTEREVIIDFYAYRERSTPEILWVECKGNQNLSDLLEGFIRLEFAIFYGGGNGYLVAPHKATTKLLKHRIFLSQAASVIKLLDIENKVTHQIPAKK